jgi:acyl-CoA dehydrogenase
MPALLTRPCTVPNRAAAAATVAWQSLQREMSHSNGFGDDYWLKKDRDGGFPHDFHRALAEAGWLGIAMPEAYGGAGLGITEAALMMQAIAESGAGMSGASAVHMNIFGLNPVVVFGTEEQKRRMLPPLIAGADKACFAVTEPDAGLNTTQAEDRAVRRATATSCTARRSGSPPRRSPTRSCCWRAPRRWRGGARRTEGLSLFYTDLDRATSSARDRQDGPQGGRLQRAVHRRAAEIPVEDRIGEEGKGFEYILHGMNPERILIAAEAVGIGRARSPSAAAYAKERIVFDRPIGQNQAIQHPLARNWMELEAADLMVMKAAWLYDRRQALRRRGQRRQVPRRRGRLPRLRDRR